ncbi:MAG TPA: 2-dehydro-3-deoxygalactonokinase [Puia sp.]
MSHFLSCDWGTSSFRLKLVDSSSQTALAEVMSHQGIAVTHQDWLNQKLPEDKRFDFYLDFLKRKIHELEEKGKHSLKNIPLLISGMASSSIGMMVLDYLPMPFPCDPENIGTKLIEASASFSHPLILISGVKTEQDVMRGEETLLIGCDTEATEQYFIFPGTHSKHILVKNGSAVGLKTYMTGEIFELLARHSILSASLAEHIREDAIRDSLHFAKGVNDGMGSNLLNAVFKVRTNQLFKKSSPEENYLYLSGLLIGYELSDLKNSTHTVMLVSGPNLKEYYRAALISSGFELTLQDADQALIRGQYRIAAQILKPSLSPDKS